MRYRGVFFLRVVGRGGEQRGEGARTRAGALHRWPPARLVNGSCCNSEADMKLILPHISGSVPFFVFTEELLRFKQEINS